MGPFVPASLIGRRLLPPVLPMPRGLRLQALHSDDMADAYRRAVLSGATGAFNVAADPVLDVPALGKVLGVRPLPVNPRIFRVGLAAA